MTSTEIGRAMEHASERVDNAIQAAQKASDLIAQLSAATAEIVGIVDTISSVARQTNLLALNATIEAVRAGESRAGLRASSRRGQGLLHPDRARLRPYPQPIDRLRDTAQGSTSMVNGGPAEGSGTCNPAIEASGHRAHERTRPRAETGAAP